MRINDIRTKFIKNILLFLDNVYHERIYVGWPKFARDIREIGCSHICIYGAGGTMNRIYSQLSEKSRLSIDFFCDKDPQKWGQEYFGIKCISPKELSKYGDDVSIIVTTATAYEQAFSELKQLGLKNLFFCPTTWDLGGKYDFVMNHKNQDIIKGNIVDLMQLCADEYSLKVISKVVKNCYVFNIRQAMLDIYDKNQYFPSDIISLKNESIVDAGASDGDSIRNILAKMNNEDSVENIYAFEPLPEPYAKLSDYVSRLPDHLKNKIFCYNLGLAEKKGTIDLGPSGINLSIYPNQKSTKVNVDKLDNILANKRITFIKIDVDGSDHEVLRGGEKSIINQKPTIAASVYHRMEDIWEIPLYVKSLVPDYRLYFRHHFMTDGDTICYCLP